MKKNLCILLCAVSALPALAQTEFRSLAFDEALKAAKAENKMVFIDCYTSWCGPCKQMAAKEFPKKEMGDYLNAKFVPLKMDMEKGEGPALLSRYDVNAFPTYLFINAEGELLHRMLGYMGTEEFIKRAEEGLSESGIISMQKRYKAGERSPEFIRAYIVKLQENYMLGELRDIAADYLKEKDTEAVCNDSLAYQLFHDAIDSPYDEIFVELYKNRQALVEKYGKSAEKKFNEVWSMYPNRFYQAEGKTVTGYDTAKLDEYAKLMKENGVEGAEEIVLSFRCKAMGLQKKWDEALKLTKEYVALPDMKEQTVLEMCYILKDNAPQAEIKAFIESRIAALEKHPQKPSDKPLYMIKGKPYYSQEEMMIQQYQSLLKAEGEKAE